MEEWTFVLSNLWLLKIPAWSWRRIFSKWLTSEISNFLLRARICKASDMLLFWKFGRQLFWISCPSVRVLIFKWEANLGDTECSQFQFNSSCHFQSSDFYCTYTLQILSFKVFFVGFLFWLFCYNLGIFRTLLSQQNMLFMNASQACSVTHLIVKILASVLFPCKRPEVNYQASITEWKSITLCKKWPSIFHLFSIAGISKTSSGSGGGSQVEWPDLGTFFENTTRSGHQNLC